MFWKTNKYTFHTTVDLDAISYLRLTKENKDNQRILFLILETAFEEAGSCVNKLANVATILVYLLYPLTDDACVVLLINLIINDFSEVGVSLNIGLKVR